MAKKIIIVCGRLGRTLSSGSGQSKVAKRMALQRLGCRVLEYSARLCATPRAEASQNKEPRRLWGLSAAEALVEHLVRAGSSSLTHCDVILQVWSRPVFALYIQGCVTFSHHHQKKPATTRRLDQEREAR